MNETLEWALGLGMLFAFAGFALGGNMLMRGQNKRRAWLLILVGLVLCWNLYNFSGISRLLADAKVSGDSKP